MSDGREDTARAEVLGRIREALGADHGHAPTIPREYRDEQGPGDPAVFAERVRDYRATVDRCTGAEVAMTITALLDAAEQSRIVVPDGFPNEWLPSVELIREPVTVAELDDVSAVLTTCAVAIAETGTIVLDAGPGQGARVLTLVPDHHVVVVRVDQVRANVPGAVAALDATRPLTWISGPSATSDIELNRVEGVHGPRRLDVVLVEGA